MSEAPAGAVRARSRAISGRTRAGNPEAGARVPKDRAGYGPTMARLRKRVKARSSRARAVSLA